MFIRKESRKYFWAPGPYITTLTAFAIFLPHIVWLFYHDFATFAYFEDRPVMAHWYAPFYFSGLQLLYLPLTVLTLIPAIGIAWKVQHHEPGKVRECEKFLFYCFMIPLVCHMLYCAIKGVELRMAYGAPFWSFAGLWLLLRFQTKETPQCFRQVVTLMAAIILSLVVGTITLFCLGKVHENECRPTRELGTTCDQH
jgi:hypothetical protein